MYLIVLSIFPCRYTVKLMYDEGSLGEVETPSELAEYLQHYDSECFIGREHESSWEGSILAQKQHLFSLGKDIEKVWQFLTSAEVCSQVLTCLILVGCVHSSCADTSR